MIENRRPEKYPRPTFVGGRLTNEKTNHKRLRTGVPFPVVAGAVAALSFGLVWAVSAPPAINHVQAVTTQATKSDVAQIHRAAVPVCNGGNRAARKVTCIYDGDTGWEYGVKWRMLGTDAPEISHYGCSRERQLGLRARDRLRELMGAGYQVEWSGRVGSYGRPLVHIRLSSGRLAGDVLLDEGLTQRWPNHGNVWCGW